MLLSIPVNAPISPNSEVFSYEDLPAHLNGAHVDLICGTMQVVQVARDPGRV